MFNACSQNNGCRFDRCHSCQAQGGILLMVLAYFLKMTEIILIVHEKEKQ